MARPGKTALHTQTQCHAHTHTCAPQHMHNRSVWQQAGDVAPLHFVALSQSFAACRCSPGKTSPRSAVDGLKRRASQAEAALGAERHGARSATLATKEMTRRWVRQGCSISSVPHGKRVQHISTWQSTAQQSSTQQSNHARHSRAQQSKSARVKSAESALGAANVYMDQEGRHFAVCLFAHTEHLPKAGSFSVALLKTDLPFCNRLAYNRVHCVLFFLIKSSEIVGVC